VLQKFNLIVVCRPEGKHAFVSVGFPGFVGVFSGMNDQGLALALHGVFWSPDGGSTFDPEGVPCTLLLRRVLEECSTVEEAERLLRRSRHTTVLSVVLCDRRRGLVVEVSPRKVASRDSVDGFCACTNHFRAGLNLSVNVCGRYASLCRVAQTTDKLTLEDVARKLHQVNQGYQTVQTMAFEPVPLRLHVAVGQCPSSSLPLKQLEVGSLLGVESAAAVVAPSRGS
jgi:predicted choloylglycine hydrolase